MPMFAIIVLVSACGDDANLIAEGVGTSCVVGLVPEGGFVSSEVYLVTESTECNFAPTSGITQVCMVFNLEGDPTTGCTENCSDPNEVTARVYCTARCAGPNDGPYITCPSDFECTPILDDSQGDPDQAGSYCVRSGS